MFCRVLSKSGNFAKVNNFRAAFRPNVCGGSTSRPCSGSGNPNGNLNSSGQFATDGNDVDGDGYEKDVKAKILQSSLQHVPQHGWSRDTVVAGAEDLGYPDTVHGLFRDPGAELALYFYSASNDSLSRLLRDGTLTLPRESKAELTAFLTNAIRTRLLMLQPYLNQWPQAIALLSKPSNAPHALSNLMTLVNDVCYYAGDRSIDTRWYTRRIGLATIYKSSELHLLQDGSQGYDDTWKFVRRAVEECVKLDTMLESNAQLAKDVVTASVSTAKNILGLTWNR
ncbi:ubiquinone biosynthesis protein COQ9, mitochondrial isoform X2 [Metopolophium dirhodum]|uniref:ubiquinone biosynthesis protein COQ9, mitochondrial isoform X2 n=1 Tax=Metopolophium dirhodum TaxID=44670 RepID=UPI00298F7209|nr:ubiquinone biosynthesis protein COQ9, mitochondrial isoform X2 [Metopolophium dirhodum]